MTNHDKLRKAFIEALELLENTDINTISYNATPEWDSISHMSLVAEIDDAFDIKLETEDIIDLSSFDKAKEILVKYGVEFE